MLRSSAAPCSGAVSYSFSTWQDEEKMGSISGQGVVTIKLLEVGGAA